MRTQLLLHCRLELHTGTWKQPGADWSNVVCTKASHTTAWGDTVNNFTGIQTNAVLTNHRKGVTKGSVWKGKAAQMLAHPTLCRQA